MRLDNKVVTSIDEVITVYLECGIKREMRDRASYGLAFSTGGEIIYTHKGRSYVSDSEHAVLLPMGESYSFTCVSSGAFPVINFSCTEPITDSIVQIPVFDAAAIIRDYEEIKAIYTPGTVNARVMSLFYGILHKLTQANTTPRLLPALRYIENNLADTEITNKLLADRCRISEIYFRRLFAESFGVSPKQFILELRIQRAKQLLGEGGLKISAIADACGFGDAYHFSRIFKKRTGYTPTEYRQRNAVRVI